MFYVPTPSVFAYISGIYKASCDDADRVSMMARTENLLMTLAGFFAAFLHGHAKNVCGFAQFDCHFCGFIVALPSGISADLVAFGQYDVVRKAGFNPVPSILTLCRLSEVN